MSLSPLFRQTSFDDLPGWGDDDHLPAFEAFRRSAFHVLTKPYRTRCARRRLSAPLPRPMRSARGRFAGESSGRHEPSSSVILSPRRIADRDRRRPRHRLLRAAGRGVAGSDRAFSGAAAVAPGRSRRCRRCQPARTAWIPISPSRAQTPDGLVEYFDRGAIERGALAGQGPGDRLAGRQGRRLLHPCPGRGAARHDRRPAAPRHLRRQVRPAFHRVRARSCASSAKSRWKR